MIATHSITTLIYLNYPIRQSVLPNMANKRKPSKAPKKATSKASKTASKRPSKRPKAKVPAPEPPRSQTPRISLIVKKIPRAEPESAENIGEDEEKDLLGEDIDDEEGTEEDPVIEPSPPVSPVTVSTSTTVPAKPARTLLPSKAPSPDPYDSDVQIVKEPYIVDVELRVWLDDIDVFSKEYAIDLEDVCRMRHFAINKICNEQVDAYISENQWEPKKRLPKWWYCWYGTKSSPTESRISPTSGTDYEVTMSLVRNKGCKWLLIQVQFGFAKSWTDLNKPQYRRPKAIPTISTKEKPSATLKRAFDDTDFPTTKKPTTTTGRMLADLENKVRAEEGTYNGVMTEIQIKWVCKRASCDNYDKFCWVNNDRHHYLSAEHLRRWATEIRSNSYDSDISLPSRDQRLDLQKEFRERQLSRSLREDAQNERRRNNYPTRASEVAPVMYPRPTMYGSPAPIQAHPTYYPPTPWHHQYGSFYPSLQPLPRPFYSIQQEVNSWNSPTPFQQPPLLAF